MKMFSLGIYPIVTFLYHRIAIIDQTPCGPATQFSTQRDVGHWSQDYEVPVARLESSVLPVSQARANCSSLALSYTWPRRYSQ